MARDYYEVLGIARTATADEIRRAHRKLAKEFHPDKNKSPEAPKRFSELQEAYDALSDPEKRKQYDQFGHVGSNANPFGGRGGRSQAGGGPPGDLMLVIRVAPHSWFYRDGMDVSIDVPITIVEAALGTSIDVPLLKGTVKLKIPAGTQSGKKLRVTGKGIVPANKTAGDFYAVIQIIAPTDLEPADADALKVLGEKLPNPRENRWV